MKHSSLWLILQKMCAPFLVIIFTYTISIIGLLLIDGVDAEGKPYHLTIFDAFYFISYTATTIGFGETPFAFTYPQRIWVSMSIFFTVTGWFYSIGTLIALLQNKLFLEEFERAKFARKVAYLKEKYIIILGYNVITSEIIKQANEYGLRSVVIEKEEQKRDHLLLENFTPPVFCLNDDAYNPEALELAGIKSPYCKAIVSLFENDALNLRIPLKVLINKTVNTILNTALDLFIKHVHCFTEEEVATLTTKLLEINLHPILFTLKIDETQAPMLAQNIQILALKRSLLKTSLKNRNLTNHLIPLMRLRNKEIEILPIIFMNFTMPIIGMVKRRVF